MIPDPLPPGEQISDELSEGQIVAALTQAMESTKPVVTQLNHALGFHKLTVTDLQVSKATRGVVIRVRYRKGKGTYLLSPEEGYEVRISSAWARVLRDRLNGMDL